MKISAVVLTKNEEKNIKDCLQALSFADETIVIDDGSSDKTREIAEKLGAKVWVRSLNGDFAAQRNFGLSKARGDWILFVDADERVTPELQQEIKEKCQKAGNFSGFYLRRKDYFLGRWLRYGETAHVKPLRLAKKNAGQWKRKVHEIWEIRKGRVEELKSSLIHYPHPTISEFLREINEYTDINAYQIYLEGQRFRLWQLFLYPMIKYGQNYCWRLGFLDGFPGLVMALMMAYHSLITRVKLWEIQSKKVA
jgi:glycosyltransferase involved in cell wall biosynthesis